MTTGSSGLRSSGSYGSLQLQQFQNGSLSIQTSPPIPPRKPPKMFKEKEGLFHWIFKFAPRRKIGMLLLCAVSAAVFVWVLYVGKGEDSQVLGMPSININATIKNIDFFSEPEEENNNRQTVLAEPSSIVGIASTAHPPPTPAVYFTGYKLPPGNPCEGFTLPPPPADKKRTGPRPCPVCYLPVDEAIALMPSAPSFSPVIKNLTYIHEENLNKSEFGGSEFGGYPSLSQREDSYDIRESMSVHCGYVMLNFGQHVVRINSDSSPHTIVVFYSLLSNYQVGEG